MGALFFWTAVGDKLFAGGFGDGEGPVELEGQQRLGGDFDAAAFGGELGDGACAAAGSEADGRAFAAAGNGADDRADCSAAAGVFGGAAISAQALLAFLGEVHGAEAVLLAGDGDGFEVEAEIGGAGEFTAARGGEDDDLGVGAAGDDDCAGFVADRLRYRGGVGLAFHGFGGVDVFFGADGDLGADGEAVGFGGDGGFGGVFVAVGGDIGGICRRFCGRSAGCRRRCRSCSGRRSGGG